MLAENRGRLLDAGDENELCTALLEQSRGENAPDPATLRNYVQAHFSYEAVGNMYFALYRDALA
ncbi:MAG: hypothetical protein ACYC1Q_10625 [Bacteroidia bacterium]